MRLKVAWANVAGLGKGVTDAASYRQCFVSVLLLHMRFIRAGV